jgi:hypothetical protein
MKTFIQFILIGLIIFIGSVLFFGADLGGFFIAASYGAWIPLFVLPSLIARNRNHDDKKWIYLVNFIFGVSGLGWIISLLWALEVFKLPKKKDITGAIREGVGTNEVVATISQQGEKIATAINNSKDSSISQNHEISDLNHLEKIKKMHELFKLGALSDSEYESEKNKLLNQTK